MSHVLPSSRAHRLALTQVSAGLGPDFRKSFPTWHHQIILEISRKSMSKGVTVSAPYFFQCALRAQLTHDCGPYLQLYLFNTGSCRHENFRSAIGKMGRNGPSSPRPLDSGLEHSCWRCRTRWCRSCLQCAAQLARVRVRVQACSVVPVLHARKKGASPVTRERADSRGAERRSQVHELVMASELHIPYGSCSHM